MPLLVCPNDSASMQTVQRNGVEFDFCPACRGVWLDRGELEKLMSLGRAADAEEPPRREHRGFRDDDDDRRLHGHRKKRPSIFDIFD